MILGLVLAALVSCDPALAALFAPPHAALGAYRVCTADEPLERVVAEETAAAAGRHVGAVELLEPLSAFGAAGPYNRAALARLYGGSRVRVVHSWVDSPGQFEATTLISPYPDASLTRLLPGTMIVTWTLKR